MILHRPRSSGSVGRDELAKRVTDFERGRWMELLEVASRFTLSSYSRRARSEEEEQIRRGQAAQSRIQRDQVSRARQELTGAALAPKNGATLGELRRQRPQTQLREIPAAVLEAEPPRAVTLDRKIFHSCLQGSPSGVAPGPGGCTNEMLRVCLDDAEILSLLFDAAEDFARGHIPDDVTRCLLLATMTALEKRDGGVRGIATGTSFRRLVAKVLARQFSKQVEQACAPFQFALFTRAGTDCVGHAIRVATEMNTRWTVLSIDAVGAFDHVLRAAMLSKVAEVPSLRELPFVKAAYARPSSYVWVDEEGVRHTIEQ